MQKIFLKWIVLTFAVVVAGAVTSAIGLPFSVHAKDAGDVVQLFLGSAALALVNATLGKVLKFITAPVNCLTLGIFSLVINAILLWWVGSLGFSFAVGNFLAAFVGSILISVANGVLGGILIRDKEKNEE